MGSWRRLGAVVKRDFQKGRLTVALSCLIEELLARQWRDHERGRYSLVKYHFAHYSFNAAGFTSGAAWETCPSPDLSEAYRFRVYLPPVTLFSHLLLKESGAPGLRSGKQRRG